MAMVTKCGMIWIRWEGALWEEWQKQSKALQWFWFVFAGIIKEAEIAGEV